MWFTLKILFNLIKDIFEIFINKINSKVLECVADLPLMLKKKINL